MRSRARRHTQSKGKLHQGYMSPHVMCVCVFQMVSWTVSTQTVVVSRCVWVPRCAKARLTHVTSFSRATPLSRHALHVSSSTVCDFSLDGTAHTSCQETCHLTAGDKHTHCQILAQIHLANTHAHIILSQVKQNLIMTSPRYSKICWYDCDRIYMDIIFLSVFYDCCAIPLWFWVKAKAGCVTSTVFCFQCAIDILAQTLVTTDSIDWPFKPPACIRSDILIHMRNWNETAQTQACRCVLMLAMFWLEKRGKNKVCVSGVTWEKEVMDC